MTKEDRSAYMKNYRAVRASKGDKTLTFRFSSEENELLREISTRKGVPLNMVIRQAFQIYLFVDRSLQSGGALYIEDRVGNKTKMMVF